MFKTLKKSTKIFLGILFVLLVLRIALTPIVKSYVNKQLNELPGYKGHVEDIEISLYRGAYQIKGLVLDKISDTTKFAFLNIHHADLSIEWKSIWKGKLVSEIVLSAPQIHILRESADLSKEPSKEHWSETVKALMPITINKLLIENGSITYLDRQASPDIDLHVDSMHLTAYNLANVDEAEGQLPSTLSFSGTSIGVGKLKGDMKLNILKEIPDFDLDMQLQDVDMISLNSFIKEYATVDVERGKFSVYAEIKLINGKIDGYVKPFVKDLKVLDWKKDVEKGGFFQAAKEAVVGLVAKVVENPKKETVATTVEIHGNLKDPKTSTWQTFLGILKNGFIKALNQGIEGKL